MKLPPLNNPTDSQKLFRNLTVDGHKSQQATGGCIMDALSPWLASQYAATAHGELTAADSPRRLDILRDLVQDWTRLRRSDRAADRSQLDRERLELIREQVDLHRKQLELNRANSHARKEKEFRRWMKNPKIREQFEEKPGGLTPEVLEKIERELNLL